MSEQKQEGNIFFKSFAGATVGVVFAIVLLLCCCIAMCLFSAALTSMASAPYLPSNTYKPSTFDTDYYDTLISYSVGEKINVGGLNLTVNDASEVTTESIAPKPGYIFLRVNVTIENDYVMSNTYGSATNFRITDSNGTQYFPSEVTSLRTLSSEYLYEGDKVTGYLTFEIPKGQTGFSLLYYGNYRTTKVSLTRG